MVLSKKSHGNKKADQETQSPVIKVFKDMMQLSDNLTNSEKANLLREKREKKKKRHAQKSQPLVKSEDTSASERPYNQVQHRISSSHPKSHSVFHSEKRESSWWAWGQADPCKDKEDTCSCVSCALKNILTQRSGIMACLVVFLALSGMVAIYCLMCATPKSTPKKSSGLKSGPADGKKCDGLEKRLHDRPIWDESKSKLMSGLSDLYDTDFGESNLHTGNLQDGSRGNAELFSILDPNKLSEGYGSSRLRNFYKKLIQTDMQIKNLKKSIRETRVSNPLDYSVFRTKRSLNPGRRARHLRNLTAADHQAFRDLHVFFPPAPVIPAYGPQGLKVKRFTNDSGPSGYVIENKKLVVKFKRPRWHKAQNRLHQQQYQHAPRLPDHQPSHSGHKDAELDEILRRLIEKNFPAAKFDPFAPRMDTATPVPSRQHRRLEHLLSTDRSEGLMHSPAKNKMQFKPSFYPPSKSSTMQAKYDKLADEMRPTVAQKVTPASMATLLDTQRKHQMDLMLRVPNIRRLLQVEVEEESDEFVANDEKGVRRKRMGQPESDSQAGSKYNPPAIHNPNWKGPMPLYPDELDIVKPAAIENTNKIDIPNKENAEDNVKDMSDTEYVEDYFNNKYDKLVKMAQAYSDYGVLDDKKDMRNEKSSKAMDNRVKLSVNKGLGLLGRLRKCKSDAALDPEGIRIEYRPENQVGPKDKKGKVSRSQFFKLGSHLKVTNDKNRELDAQKSSKKYEYLVTPPGSLKYPKDKKVSNEDETPLFSRHKRSLMSINEDGTEPVIVESFQADDRNELGIDKPDTVGNNDNPVQVNNDSLTDSNGLITQTTSFINEATIPKKLDTDVTATNKSINANRTNVNSINPKVIGDIFGLIASWVKELAGFENEDYEHDNETSIFMDFLIMVNPENTPTAPVKYSIENLNKSTTINPIYPNSYSEKVENIGHRSRVLMSVEEKTDNATGNTYDKDKIRSEGKVSDKESTNATTGMDKTHNVSTVDANVDSKETVENKTIKKRSAYNSNLILWNDMYDDEYGIKDPLDALKSKDSVFKDGLSRSENWFGMKLKKIADNIRNPKIGKKEPIELRDKQKKIVKRNTLFGGGDDTGDKINFKELTANMKKICREAAEAVQETKTVEVPPGSTDGEASTLMRQLVGLMADLVEVQVQEKTCVPLPPDLRTFLVWLTSPNPEETNPPLQSFDDLNTEPPIDTLRDTTSIDMYPSDVRTECLGTIHEVEDLIQLYDEMSEEDKSKMSGVREYLENQLDFLHKQLSTFDGYNDPSMFPIRIRRRRQSDQKKHRRLHKFLKSFGRKRTRSTASFDTLEPFTDNRQTSRRIEASYTIGAENDNNDKIKRNLPDVYFRALANTTTTASSKSD